MQANFSRTTPLKVLIADDQRLYREGIKALLNAEDFIDIEVEVSSGTELLASLKQYSVDIILMDIDMPGMNGIEATRQVKTQYPDTRILILSMYDHLEFILDVLRAGASGYVLKDADNLDLPAAIKALAGGSSYYSEAISSKLCNYLVQVSSPGLEAYLEDPPALTQREQEVLTLIGQEYTNHEIAEKLFISPNTVLTHRKNLLKKLYARNTAGLIKSATKLGFIQ
ncbi:MAG: response regulator transcription factor [Cyclobacteriaceae bacterium]|jgi:DNA-binding NarL/FixJ family response regulator